MATTGALRDGRFVLLNTLGEGSQGRTFDAVDKREGRAVAIKRFDVRGASSWKDVELAEREARVLQSLSHPRLPRYIDHFEEDGALYLVMEKIEGESLAAWKQHGGTFGEEQVWRLLGDASEVLDYLHGRDPPVIHRDLKPGNVIRKKDGSFAFVDFGAVRDKLRPKGGSTVVGTFGFMAPEQMQGRALPASDVYALGATALSLLTGSEPEDLPHKGLAIDVRAALAGRGSGRIASVLERMLEPDPDKRASRLAPLLAAAPAARPRSGSAARDGDGERWTFDAWGDPWGAQWSRRATRHARRVARRAERAARRQARWQTRGRTAGGVPWPVRILLTVLVLWGTVAVTLALRVVVPIVLLFLSIFFARRPLQRAAAAVRQAGRSALDWMDRSRRWIDDGATGERPSTAGATATPGARVDGGAEVRVRVAGERGSGGPERDENEEDAEDEDDDRKMSL